MNQAVGFSCCMAVGLLADGAVEGRPRGHGRVAVGEVLGAACGHVNEKLGDLLRGPEPGDLQL